MTMQPKNTSNPDTSFPGLSLSRGNRTTSQKHIGATTKQLNPTTSMP